MSLYAGVNYHPHDWSESRWEKDVKMMKEASISVVRLGHLCWDSFEYENGKYSFEWFDKVLGLFEKAGIKVLLDIPTRPAPIWLHKICPSIDIVSLSRTRQDDLRRYMEDVDDPMFQKYAYRFAEVLVKRYADNKAVIGFGLCNELGAGYISYSEGARIRFINWLKEKYVTVEKLNKAWATQRWSRRLSSFDDVVLPKNEIEIGSPESYLDMRRFYSDGIIKYITGLHKIVKDYAPNKTSCSNHVAESMESGFDYLKSYKGFVDYPGMGFYPNTDPENKKNVFNACMTLNHRLAESEMPMWNIEFQTGTYGIYGCPPGAMRMYAYLTLILRSQMVLAWTWRSMLSGEEQYLFGLLDHDGTPGYKYDEFKKTAEEFEKLQNYAFPRKPKIEIAMAFSYDSGIVCQYAGDFYKTPYASMVCSAYQAVFKENLDCNFVSLREFKKGYKLLIIPGCCIMEKESAENVRRFVAEGGIVIMTGYSAKVDETNKVFDTPQPGLINDVFGVRVKRFDRVAKAGKMAVSFTGEKIEAQAKYYEMLELLSAQTVACFTGSEVPAVTLNRFGRGKAYYCAAEPDEKLIRAMLHKLCEDGLIEKGPQTPDGLAARKIDSNKILFVNTTPEVKKYKYSGGNVKPRGIIKDKTYGKEIELPPYDCDLVEF